MFAAKLLISRMPAPLMVLPVRFKFKKIKRRVSGQLKPKDPKMPLDSDEDWAFNHVLKKETLKKPIHSLEEQKEYMQSEEFVETYEGRPIYMRYRRNLKGQWKVQPPPRLFCIDRNGRMNVPHPCPVCRDEYLFFDFRNPALLEHFLFPGTDRPLPLLWTGLCIEQFLLLRAQVLKAKEHGTMTFSVPFRHFDYTEWYPELLRDPRGLGAPVYTDTWELPKRESDTVEELYPNPEIVFPAHNPDPAKSLDEWWVRHDKFAKKRS